MRPLYHVLSFVLLLVLIAGCDSATPDIESAVPLGTPALLQAGSTVADEVVINDAYRITYSTNGSGTFSYRVEGILDGGAALDNVLLENTCGANPTSTSPRNAVQYGRTVTGTDADGEEHTVTGVLFNKGLGANQRRTYSYTLEGAQEGVIRLVLTRSNTSYVAELPGPCRAVSALEGRVAIDGTLDEEADGIGLGGAAVQVYDGDPATGILVGTTTTVAGGAYTFDLLWSEYTTNGFYTVVVPDSEGNDYLYNYYEYEDGGLAAATFELPAQTEPIVFRFAGDPAALNEALQNEFATDAVNVRDLRRALRKALQNRNPGQGLPRRNQLVPVLAQITYEPGESEEDYFLDQAPFIVEGLPPAGTEAWEDGLLNWAKDIVDNPAQSNEAEALRNGLAIQVSYLLGRGVDGAPEFDFAFQLFNEDFLIDLLAASGQGRAAAGVGTVDPQAPGGTGGVIEDFVSMQDQYLAGGTGGVIE